MLSSSRQPRQGGRGGRRPRDPTACGGTHRGCGLGVRKAAADSLKVGDAHVIQKLAESLTQDRSPKALGGGVLRQGGWEG